MESCVQIYFYDIAESGLIVVRKREREPWGNIVIRNTTGGGLVCFYSEASRCFRPARLYDSDCLLP